MHLLMVCLCLAVYRPASTSTAATNTSFFSMPVQFSMAAPLPPESSDWSPSPTTAISSRRGYPGPPRPHRRKHRLSHQEMVRMYAMRRRYPKYPPFLEPYSHNYKQSHLHPNYHLKPAGHRLRPEHRPQHNSYVDYPPYAAHYQPTGNDYSEPTRHQPPHEQRPQHQQHHPPGQQSLAAEYSQYPPQFQHNDQNSHPNIYQSPNTEYQQQPSQFLSNEQLYPPKHQAHNFEYQSPNTEYQQNPSQFLSNEQSYPPKHQAHNFEYPQLPPDYQTGETFSQFPNENYQNIPEPHIPHYQSEYMDSPMYSGSQHPSQMQPHTNYQPHSPGSSPPPEYNAEMAKELLELNKEIGLMQEDGNSNKSMLRLLVPLLMLGISIPALGYMYSHMIRRRSFQDWSSQDTVQEFMEILQRGIECYQHKGECSVS